MYHVDYTLAQQWHEEHLRAAARRRLVAEARKAGNDERAARGPLRARTLTRLLPKRTAALLLRSGSPPSTVGDPHLLLIRSWHARHEDG